MAKKEVARYDVNPKAVAYVQMLHYDADGLRVLCTQIAGAGGDNSKFLEEYRETYRAWRVAFETLQHEAAPQFCKPGYMMELDYFANILYVYEEV